MSHFIIISSPHSSRQFREDWYELMRKNEHHKESRFNQRREHDMKVKLLRTQVEDRDKRIEELEEKNEDRDKRIKKLEATNKYLTKFYRDNCRDNKDRRPRCAEGAATSAAAEGRRTRRGAREHDQHRNNPEAIELAPIDSPSAASSSVAASRREKPSVELQDQKLIVDTKQKPTGRVHGVQRP